MPSRLERAFYDIGRLDILAAAETPLHRLDPRAKLLTTMVFILCVVSFDRYEISRLLPFFLYPAILVGLGNLPLGYLLKKLVIVSPFVLFIGIFNPLIDRAPMVTAGPLVISGGWISFASLLLRFLLTVGCALLLLASTGFASLCMAMEKLGVPNVFAVQLLLLYRYLFVLVEETIRVIRAHSLRSLSRKGKIGFQVYSQITGNLLLRTLDRAQRIHMAMLSRAFTGTIRIPRRFSFGRREWLFVGGFSILFLILRTTDLPALLGGTLLGTR
ncbi:MAG: cobalt ECF transporter T component CbiQ [Desulfobulbaceae bacterium]